MYINNRQCIERCVFVCRHDFYKLAPKLKNIRVKKVYEITINYFVVTINLTVHIITVLSVLIRTNE